MKRNTFIIFVLIFFSGLFWSCGQKVKIVPEITPVITEEIIYEIKDRETLGKIIKHEDKLVFITLKGEIFRFDPAKKAIESLTDFDIDIDPEIFTQNNMVVLKQRDTSNYTIFDLDEMQQPGKKIDNLTLDRIIGIDKNLLVYRNKNKLFIFDYHSNTNKKEVEIEKDTLLFNSEFSGNSILILSNRKLYTYDKSKNTVQACEMKDGAASGFLLDNGCIYYGSENRKLVKFSLRSKKVKWSFNLPVILKLKPQKTDRRIIITPEDNNIYFFNKKGSLRRWAGFDSPRALPAVVMKENVAVFLMNRAYRWMNNKIRFFNYKKDDFVSYEFNYQLESNPVYLNDYLYLLSKDEEKEVTNISKIGNRYDVELEIKPEHVKPMGKSITFTIKPINLIDPQARVTIFDKSQKSVFSKEIGKDKDLFFVWVPEKAEKYKCTIEINAENKKNLKVEGDFNVVDINKIVTGYYFELYKRIPTLFLKDKKNAEKSEKLEKQEEKAGETKKRKKRRLPG
jgi:hypothetical protein